MRPVRIRSIPWQQWPEWSSAWTGLLAANPALDSFFLCPAWIEAWLAVYGEELAPELLLFFDGKPETPVGACLLVRRQRMQGVRLRSVYLNCDGEDEADSTYIEYNALLALPEFEASVAQALAEHVQALGWDRLLISGAVPQGALAKLAESLGRVETDARPCHYVDLARLRNEATPYRQAISGNTRKQNGFTRRSLERAFGLCVLELAATERQAAEYFGQLADLHVAAWRARDKAGIFSSPRFLAFHRNLMSRLFSSGQILLYRLNAGGKLIAVLYCFVYRRRVYFYQSGIHYGEDKRLRPGFLALTMVIEHLQNRADADEFDFLAGDAQYKKSLGTGARELHWTTVWAPSFSSGAFRALKFLKGAIESQVG